jgi:acyl-CoA thioester hydrolase
VDGRVGARVYGVGALRRVAGGVVSRALARWPAGMMPGMSAVSEAGAQPGIHEQRRTVQDVEIDELGHVNNLRYIEWMLAAAVDHSSAAGWPAERYRELGNAWVVRSHAIEYLRPAFAGDEIVVRTWVSEMGKVSSRRKTAIVRADGQLLARAETLWVFVNRRGHGLDRVPAVLQAAFPVVAPGPDA